MNILTFNEAAWNDKNSFGNTISNLFLGDTWSADSFSNFFCRSQLPENGLSVHYYRLTSIDILKGILRGRIRGEEFFSSDLEEVAGSLKGADETEKKRIHQIHKKKTQWIYYVNACLWMSKVWLNRPFKEFIEKNAPDIFFAFAYAPTTLWPIISYLKKCTKSKIVLFITDDVKGANQKYKQIRKTVSDRKLKQCIESADKLYAVSEEMAKLYSAYYEKEIDVLNKGCIFDHLPKDTVNDPLRFVYAGNLLWGRDETLSLLAQAFAKINQVDVKAKLEIYSGTTKTPELEKNLNLPNASQLMGERSYPEIKEIIHGADVVIHVESFEDSAVKLVKYSFSTKIIDCLQSGSLVMGIGPKNIASIEYLRKVDGVIVIDDLATLESQIESIVNQKQRIPFNASLTRQYAMEHHEIHTVQQKLRNDFEALMKT